MKVAIIGAGLAGLGAAHFLIEEGAKVTLFDSKGIGAGASGVCSGLLHPYPGLSARRSKMAHEALSLTQSLISLAEETAGVSLATREGILRQSINAEQKERLSQYEDVERLEEDLFLIKSGCTVYCLEYLHALSTFLKKRGALFLTEKIEDLNRLHSYDRILLACGYGIRQFTELRVEFLKGQLLCYKGSSPHPKSFISKGYIAKTREGYEVGSTYERHFLSEEPCPETAHALLPQQSGELIEVKAAVRVCPRGTYLPLIEQLSSRRFVFTGLGSRGLLYHALFGKKVAQMILSS